MYSRLPSLVLGFHGCSKETQQNAISENGTLNWSRNDYDWLGSGVYFWEQNYDRALEWARDHADGEPAVVGAVIDLGYCLNLTDSRYIDLVAQEYEIVREECEVLGKTLQENTGGTADKAYRRLDRQVIEHLLERIEEEYKPKESSFKPFDSVRGLFSEGDPVYKDAGFKKKTHVQICVRNPNCIKGYFYPRQIDPDWRTP